MKHLVLLYILILCFSCSPKNSSKPELGDLDHRGVLRPLDNETDPNKVENWFTKGPSNSVEGVNIEKSYHELNLYRNAQSIIVAVIDGGVDIHHPDLRDRIWTNIAEANGKKGIDDDNNGYVDDIHGWNFLGSYDSDGRPVNINYDRLERTRELSRLKKLASLTLQEQVLLKQYTSETEAERKVAQVQISFLQLTLEKINKSYKNIFPQLRVEFSKLTIEDIEKFNPRNFIQKNAKEKILEQFYLTNARSVQRLQIRIANLTQNLNYALNENFDPRAQITKDNPDDFSSGQYGNHDVIGEDALHGTHVAGIIAANRENNFGIEGIANNVRIMPIRAVPNGDEYDKDIYFAVKYAVDNGARIINMSFAKRMSPHKEKLDSIFQYAASHGVLLVHAAGNYSSNIDQSPIFPNRFLKDSSDEINTWIEVAANTRYFSNQLVALFSNFGKKTVDIFAPGYEVKSTTPNNTYTILSGTSMAAPAITGVLAMMLAQRPDLTPLEIKSILLNEGRDRRSLKVYRPGAVNEFVSFSSLTKTGRVVDSYNALKKMTAP